MNKNIRVYYYLLFLIILNIITNDYLEVSIV